MIKLLLCYLLMAICLKKSNQSHLASEYMAPTIMLNDGNKMPGLALGTGRGTAKVGETLDMVRTAVYWALTFGYRHIDTASIYNTEREVGLGLNDAIESKIVDRHDVFITTKLWNTEHEKEKVIPALTKSLKQLKIGYVDLYLMHFPVSLASDGTPGNVDYLETWAAMEQAQARGYTKSIGVSNFNKGQLQRLIENATVKPVVNQIEVNPTMTQHELVDFCHSEDIAVMAYSPFGFIVSRDKHKVEPPPSADDPELLAMANRYNKTVAQVLLRYLVTRGLIPVVKSTNRDRIEKNIDIFDFKLSLRDVEKINKFNKNIRVIDVLQWKYYPFYPF